jgi:ribonucleotide monophosphatase NagD (HAD superfamily)
VARTYGFNHAIGVAEFQRQHPELTPFKKFPPSGSGKPEPPLSVPFPSIAAVLVFGDPEDAFNDAQVVLDIITAPYGQIGSGICSTQSVPIYHSHDDFLWSSEAPLPRLASGGPFREMLATWYRCLSGDELQVVQYGKPRTIAYKFAQHRLKELSKSLGWDPAALRCIAMVGDNLQTDIHGANAAGYPWLSVHVLSGVGNAPTAARTIFSTDDEGRWLEDEVPMTPHYVAPTLDHFVRELLHFPEQHIIANRKNVLKPAPVKLRDIYNFKHIVL